MEGDGPARLARPGAAGGARRQRPRHGRDRASCSRRWAAPPIPGPYLETVVAGPRPSQTAGSAAQQARWLPAIAGGAARATVALLDAELDWRPEAAATRAEPDAGGVRLTGVKQFVAVGPRGRRAPRAGAGARGALALPGRGGRRRASTSHRCRRWTPGCAGRRCGSTACRCGAEARARRARRRGRAARRPAPARRGRRRGRDARRGAPLPRHGRRVREGARAVRPADRLVPGHPPPVRRDAARGGERPRGDLLRGLGAGRGRRGRARWPPRSRRPT